MKKLTAFSLGCLILFTQIQSALALDPSDLLPPLPGISDEDCLPLPPIPLPGANPCLPKPPLPDLPLPTPELPKPPRVKIDPCKIISCEDDTPVRPSTPAPTRPTRPSEPSRPYTPAKPNPEPQRPTPPTPTPPAPTPSCQKPYPTDIDGHWSEIYVRRLYDLCIVEGYSDRTFRPHQNITRAEMVKMALSAVEIPPKPGCYDEDCGSPFMDLDMWQGPWIRAAWDRGIVQGVSHDRFEPNRSITRAEAVKVILATLGYQPVYTDRSTFRDVSGWSTGWIERAYQLGFVQGMGNGNFEPNRPITRAEAAKVIVKAYEHYDTYIRTTPRRIIIPNIDYAPKDTSKNNDPAPTRKRIIIPNV